MSAVGKTTTYAKVLTTSRQHMFTAPAGKFHKIGVISVSNITAGAVTVTLEYYQAATTTYFSIATGESIPANSSVRLEGADVPLIALADGDRISATAGANTSLHCILTVEEKPKGRVNA